MEIIKATYGGVDVTSIVRSFVKNNKLVVKASNDVFGDLAPGIVKTLEIQHDSGIKIVKEGGFVSLPETSINKLGIFYTNNNIDKVVETSLQTLTKFEGIADILTCGWKPINNNPFYEVSAMTKSSIHLNIVIQILQLLYTARKTGTYDYVSFLEHDVLYPDGYFDFAPFDHGIVLTNMNYKGICGDGWQTRGADHEPLHQMTMRFNDAVLHFEEMLKLSIEQGGILVEPQLMQRAQWYCVNPAVHVNHGKNFTSHYSIYSKTTHAHDPYWGNAEDWVHKLF